MIRLQVRIIKESNLKETFGSASKGGAEGKPFGRPLDIGRKQSLSAEEQAARSDMAPVK